MKPPPPPLPDLDASDLPELRSLPWKELKKVPHVTGHWHCAVEGCKHYKVVRDFGIFPVVWVFDEWVNVMENMMWCGEHWKDKQAQAAGDIERVPWFIKPQALLRSEIQSMFSQRYWKIQSQIEQYAKEKANANNQQR